MLDEAVWASQTLLICDLHTESREFTENGVENKTSNESQLCKWTRLDNEERSDENGQTGSCWQESDTNWKDHVSQQGYVEEHPQTHMTNREVDSMQHQKTTPGSTPAS